MQRVVNGASVFLRVLYIASAITFAGTAILYAPTYYMSWFALGKRCTNPTVAAWSPPIG
jgi:hypothetical protein